MSALLASLITVNLFLGSSGMQVTALQQMLNRDIDTRVASTGPGSLGNETDYFGPLTKTAVMRFQEKYAAEVLLPVGLAQGSGYVGFYTRTKLNALSASTTNTETVALAPVVVLNVPTLTFPDSTIGGQNPNLKNIDLYVTAVKKLGLKQGISSDTLSLIEEKIRKGADTSIDFRQQFFNNQKAVYEKKVSENISESPVLAFLKKTFSFTDEIFSAKKAYAGLGLPFGGYITYVNPIICDCPPGIITQIFVSSSNMNPTASNLLLNYVNFSQGFLWHNIPEPGIAVLGTYIPFTPSCWTYVGVACVLVPSEGQITPMVGSSLLPG